MQWQLITIGIRNYHDLSILPERPVEIRAATPRSQVQGGIRLIYRGSMVDASVSWHFKLPCCIG